jgi:hypothetical protein
MSNVIPLQVLREMAARRVAEIEALPPITGGQRLESPVDAAALDAFKQRRLDEARAELARLEAITK